MVPAYANAASGARCVLKYLSKLPAVAFQKDIFYMKPKAAPLADADSLWYEGVPVGKETLRTMLANSLIPRPYPPFTPPGNQKRREGLGAGPIHMCICAGICAQPINA